MRNSQHSHSRTTTRILYLLAALGLTAMLGCSQGKANGTVLILELDNSEHVNQYWVFNPYIVTIDKCKAAAKQAIAEVLASTAVPKDSKVVSWRCSFTPPENDK